MTNNKVTKKDHKEESEEMNTIFWLKKIYEKMDTIDRNLAENNQAIKNNSKRLDAICEEVKQIRNMCGNEPPLRNKGTKESSVATNDVNTPCDVITPTISPVF